MISWADMGVVMGAKIVEDMMEDVLAEGDMGIRGCGTR